MAAYVLLLIASVAAAQSLDSHPATMAQAANVGGVLYAAQCNGSEMGAKIMDCQARLPTSSAGYHVGTIVLPNTSGQPDLATWATTAVLGPGVNLRGQGVLASSFACTVVHGDCLQYRASDTSGPHKMTTGVATTWEGFTLTGNGAIGQNIIHLMDAENLSLRDIGADGASEPGGACFLLEDVRWWTERNTFLNVSSLYKCATGWRFTVAKGNPYEPHPSFGYNRFLDIKANPNNGQTAVSVENDATIYNSTINMTANADGTRPSIYWHMQDGAELYQSEVHLYGENNFKYVVDLESASNQFIYSGKLWVGPQTNHIASRALFINYLDNGGTGIPGNGSTSYISPIAITPAGLPGGYDLNSLNACGTFYVNAPMHGPLTASDPLKVVSVCGTPEANTQIAFLVRNSDAHQQRTWMRIEDNGTWGPWREQAWMDRAPLVGTTNHLSGKPIPAGTCELLTATMSTNGLPGDPGVTGAMSLVVTQAFEGDLGVGFHFDHPYRSGTNTVTVPFCNETSTTRTPKYAADFNVRAIP